MAREDPQLKFRVPAELRAMLEEAASSNGRSLSAEIVQRLFHSFSDELVLTELTKEFRALQQHNGDLRREINDLLTKLEEKSAPTPEVEHIWPKSILPSPENTLYIILDGDGIPSSWPEIMAHLGNIVRAKGVNYQSLMATIFDADLKSSSDREEQWFDLVQAYRTKLKNQRQIDKQSNIENLGQHHTLFKPKPSSSKRKITSAPSSQRSIPRSFVAKRAIRNIDLRSDIEKAEERGRAAYHDDPLATPDNPFPTGSDEHDAFEHGYEDEAGKGTAAEK